MKTISDLDNMKNQSCPPFESAYEYLISSLEDYYISKMDGKARIKHELNNWDKDAKKVIIDILIKRLRPTLMDFDPNDLLELQ